MVATEAPRDEVAELTESLRLARHELKLARGEQEVAVETLQRVRRQRATLRDQVRLCSEALAEVLSQRYWDSEQPKRRRALLGRADHTPDTERELVAEVEASELFDGGWYLRHTPEAVQELISPAVHYVRSGGREGREPGPQFNTADYLREHPEAGKAELPPLLHKLRHGRG